MPETAVKMNAQILNEEMLKRYLLGDISEEERHAIEERFLQDDTFFEEMLALEDELYFDYQQNRLNHQERAAFEQKFLKSAEDKEKAVFAKAFLRATAEIAEEKNAAISDSASRRQSIAAFFDFSNRALQFGFASVLVLLLLGAIGLFIQNARRQDEMANLQTNRSQEPPVASNRQQQNNSERQPENEKPQIAQNEKPLQENEAPLPNKPEIARNNQPAKKDSPQVSKKPTQTPPAQRSVIATILSPGLFTRSDGQGFQRVTLSPSVKNVQIRLLLKTEETYKNFRAVLKKVDDETQIWTSADLKFQGSGKNKNLLINIPAKILDRTDYEISLLGVTENGETEEITSYYFSVVKNGAK